jgi:hypothetical protein
MPSGLAGKGRGDAAGHLGLAEPPPLLEAHGSGDQIGADGGAVQRVAAQGGVAREDNGGIGAPEVRPQHGQEGGDDPELFTYFVGERRRGAAVLNRELEARAQHGQGRAEDTTRVNDMTVDDPQDIARAPPLLNKGE